MSQTGKLGEAVCLMARVVLDLEQFLDNHDVEQLRNASQCASSALARLVLLGVPVADPEPNPVATSWVQRGPAPASPPTERARAEAPPPAAPADPPFVDQPPVRLDATESLRARGTHAMFALRSGVGVDADDLLRLYNDWKRSRGADRDVATFDQDPSDLCAEIMEHAPRDVQIVGSPPSRSGGGAPPMR